MTKQEVEIEYEKWLGNISVLRKYIASLEAENIKLKKALEKAINAAMSKGFCPKDESMMKCLKTNNYDCPACWREYLRDEK